jgi:hypothetical protein
LCLAFFCVGSIPPTEILNLYKYCHIVQLYFSPVTMPMSCGSTILDHDKDSLSELSHLAEELVAQPNNALFDSCLSRGLLFLPTYESRRSGVPIRRSGISVGDSQPVIRTQGWARMPCPCRSHSPWSGI